MALCCSRVDSDHLDAVELDSDTCRDTVGDDVDDDELFDSLKYLIFELLLLCNLPRIFDLEFS